VILTGLIAAEKAAIQAPNVRLKTVWLRRESVR
jgi:hypothetical protein